MEREGGKRRGSRPALQQEQVEQKTRAQQVLEDLKALARQKVAGRYADVQRLIIRYAIERFISRLSRSRFHDAFILKGAMATAIYVPNGFRTTRDADFQLQGHYTPASLKEQLTEICQFEEDDGLVFSPDQMVVEEAGKDRGYTGFNVKIPTRLGASACNVELDICFGEVITPDAQETDYPVLLESIGLDKPRLKVYPLETILAEKFQIIVNFGESNGRLKDYYDIAGIASTCVVSGPTLRDAIRGTFVHRKTAIPTEVPVGLTAEFYEEKRHKNEWANWLKSQSLPNKTSLPKCCADIAAMLMSVAYAAATDQPFPLIWKDGGWMDAELSVAAQEAETPAAAAPSSPTHSDN
jgi:predicted nucleotidyltransferase component of viral defense system